jgi:hypothetical protein
MLAKTDPRRATLITALRLPLADRLIREAIKRNCTVGDAIEAALIEGWFVKPRVIEASLRSER